MDADRLVWVCPDCGGEQPGAYRLRVSGWTKKEPGYWAYHIPCRTSRDCGWVQ